MFAVVNADLRWGIGMENQLLVTIRADLQRFRRLTEGKTVILEIDPPEDETARRRQGFYQRCGFTVNPFPHVHPPYHVSVPPGHPLVVMSCPDALSPEQYRAFRTYLKSTVMADVTR